MSDFICQPNFLFKAHLKEIYPSQQLLELFQQEDPVAYMRNIHSENLNLFFNIIDEALLRGYYFERSFVEKSKLFPHFIADGKELIIAEENTRNFEKIDFFKIGLGPLIKRFQIENDRFFHLVPIDGFLNLNHIVSIDNLKGELETQGFKIISSKDFNVSKNISSESTGQLYIFDYFETEKFFYLKRFCDKLNLTYLHELTPDIIEKLWEERSVGAGKMEKVYNRIRQLEKEGIPVGSQYEMETKVFNDMLELFINNSFKNYCDVLEIEYVPFLNTIFSDERPLEEVLNEASQQMRKKVEKWYLHKHKSRLENLTQAIKTHEKYEMLKDLPLKLINQSNIEQSLEIALEDFISVDELESLLESLNKYRTFRERIDNIIARLEEREKLVIEYRANEKTLQEVGDTLEVTRERARQIENKVLQKKVNNLTMRKHLNVLLEYLLGEKQFIHIEDLYEELNLSNTSHHYLFMHYLTSLNQFLFDTELNGVISNELHNSIKDKLSTLINAPILSKEEVQSFSEVHQIDLEILEHYLLNNRFQQSNKCYFKESGLPMPNKIHFIFKHHFLDEALTLDEAGFNELKAYLKQYFNDTEVTNLHSIMERVRSAENVILVGPATFQYHDPETFDMKFIDKVDEILKTLLETRTVVTSMIVFEQESELMSLYNIRAHQHLYSLIQFYLSDEYMNGRGNTFEIRPLDSGHKANKTSLELLYEFLHKNNKKVSRQKVLNHFLWRDYKLDQMIGRVEDLVVLKDRSIVHIDYFGLGEHEINKIIRITNNELKNGYILTGKLFNDLMFEDDFEQLFVKHRIEEEYEFGQLLKKFIPTLQGHSNLLYESSSPYNSISKVIAHEFKGVVSREEVVSFIEEAMYGESTIYLIIGELLSSGYFISYSSSEFINVENLQFTPSVKESLKQYLQQLLGERQYMTLKDAHGFTTKIEKVSEYDWTSYLLFAFADQCGFRKLPNSNDMRFNKLFIAQESLPINSFEELLKYTLENEYQGEFITNNVLSFLKQKKLHQNSRELPIELREGQFFYVNEFDMIVRKPRWD